MLLRQTDLDAIHRYCTHHRPLLERSASAGCISCGASFAPAEIKDWVDSDTAKCPRCGVDSVLPSAAPVMLDERMLHAMRTYWFTGTR